MRLTCTIILYKMPLTVSTYTKSSWANPSILYFPLKHFHSIVLHGPTYDYYWLLELHLFAPQLYSGGDNAINKCIYLSSLVFRYLFCKGFYKESSEPNSKGTPLICNTGFLYTQKRVMKRCQQLIQYELSQCWVIEISSSKGGYKKTWSDACNSGDMKINI